MPAPRPELALDVFDIEIGFASQGEVSGLAFRFHLRDGTTMIFALTDGQATSLAVSLLHRLAESKCSPKNAMPTIQ
jgi:hypothetical protein